MIRTWSLSLLSLLFCCALTAQVEVYDSSFWMGKEWSSDCDEPSVKCRKEGNSIVVQTAGKDDCYCGARSAISMSNRSYSEIEFYFSMSELEGFREFGVLLQDDVNSQELDGVTISVDKSHAYLTRITGSGEGDPRTLVSRSAPLQESGSLRRVNSMLIILHNEVDSLRPSHVTSVQVLLNGSLVISTDWSISNFSRFLFYADSNFPVSVGDVHLMQSEELSYKMDLLDFVFEGENSVIDHNGVKLTEIIEFLPKEMISGDSNYTPQELLALLRANSEFKRVRIENREINGQARELCAFSYNDVSIEFFVDQQSVSPFFIYFLSESDMNSFFSKYGRYLSYRLEGDRYVNPESMWHVIDRNLDGLKCVVWSGFPF